MEKEYARMSIEEVLRALDTDAEDGVSEGVLAERLSERKKHKIKTRRGPFAAFQPEMAVVRGGHVMRIPYNQVVVGDIIELKYGDSVLADMRVIDGELAVTEGSLNGEEHPVKKSADVVDHEDERWPPRNIVLCGSATVEGKGRCVVFAVPPDTVVNRMQQKRAPKKRDRGSLFEHRVARHLEQREMIFVSRMSAISDLRKATVLLCDEQHLLSATPSIEQAYVNGAVHDIASLQPIELRELLYAARVVSCASGGFVECSSTQSIEELGPPNREYAIDSGAMDIPPTHGAIYAAWCRFVSESEPPSPGALINLSRDPTRRVEVHAFLENDDSTVAVYVMGDAVAVSSLCPPDGARHRNCAQHPRALGCAKLILNDSGGTRVSNGDLLEILAEHIDEVQFLGAIPLLFPVLSGVNDALKEIQEMGMRVVIYNAHIETLSQFPALAPDGAVESLPAFSEVADPVVDHIEQGKHIGATQNRDVFNMITQLQDADHRVLLYANSGAPALSIASCSIVPGDSSDVVKEAGDMLCCDGTLVDVIRATLTVRRAQHSRCLLS